jgi:hypothetical protein
MELDECYSYRSLGRLIGKDRRWVKRRLDEGKVFPRKGGRIWISDLEKIMPQFLESFATKLRMLELADDPHRNDREEDY